MPCGYVSGRIVIQIRYPVFFSFYNTIGTKSSNDNVRFHFIATQSRNANQIAQHSTRILFISLFSFLVSVFEFFLKSLFYLFIYFFLLWQREKQYRETELHQRYMDWFVGGVYNKVVMAPPIAAISFIRLLCGMCWADVGLYRRRMRGKMEPSERYNCVCVCVCVCVELGTF